MSDAKTKAEERAKELAHLVAEDVDVCDSKTAIARILAYRDEVLEEAAESLFKKWGRGWDSIPAAIRALKTGTT